MLSHIWTADAAMPARARSRTGTSFAGGCAAVSRERAEKAVTSRAAAATVVAGLRPQASASAVTFGNAAHAAGKATVASQQRISQKKYARTTRIAALGGGALGPHPAWDPV
jgi:hypothetical protein